MCSMLKKKKNILCLSFKTQLKTWKASYSFNNFNRKGRHYLAVIRLFLLLREATSTQNCDSYCLNCFHLFRTKNRHKQVCELKIFVLPSKDTKILKFSQYYKGPYIKYVGERAEAFYKFFKQTFIVQGTIELNILWPSNFFGKKYMIPPINFSFSFKAWL